MRFTITFGVFNVRLGLTFSKMFVVRDEDRFPGYPAFTRGHLCGHTERSIGQIVEEGHLTIIVSSVLYLHLCWCVHVRLQACSYFIAFICSFSHLLRLCNLPLQFCSVAQSCLILCDPMDCSLPGFPVHHQLPELAHVHQVSDAIQPSYLLSSPSPHAFNLSQHQGLFQ